MVCEVHETIDIGLCNIETGDGGSARWGGPAPASRTSAKTRSTKPPRRHNPFAPTPDSLWGS